MHFIREITLKTQKAMEGAEILLFIGARQAGKTTILRQLEQFLKDRGDITYFLNLEDPEYLSLLDDSPKNLLTLFPINLSQKTFILIDEIQYLKNPTNFLKYFYDEYHGKIKLLVTGSSAFYIDNKFKDSLVGRKKLFYVYTLSFREFLNFKNEHELAKKSFSDLALSEKNIIKQNFYEYTTFGGYPRVVLANDIKDKKEILRDIAYSYIKRDILDSRVKQEVIFYKLFKILAAQVGQLVNAAELAHTLGVSRTAIDFYLYVMRKSFHIEFIRPFFRNVRKELTKMPKVYFMDLGLRNFFIGNFESFDTRLDSGLLLENATFRQLINAYDALEINFWRTQQKQEVDFILSGKEALEVKMNLKQFHPKKYKIFHEYYQDIPLNLVTLNKDVNHYYEHKVFNAWEI